MQPPHSGNISTPGSAETWTWKLSPTLASKILEKWQNVSKMGPKRLPKSTKKSIKTDTWTSSCLLGVPVDPWITKMITQGTKMESQGLQNVSFGDKKWSI